MNKISIAMTTYNGEKYIEKQLLSLLNQSRKPDEVIIKDDDSTDDTVNIVSSFIKEHHLNNWKFTVNENNIGYKKNFYNAISETSGDIIFLCDQDDIWYEDKINEIARLFEQNNQLQAVNTSFDFIDGEDDKIVIKQIKNKSNNNLLDRRIKDASLNRIQLGTILYKNISPGCTLTFTKQIKNDYINAGNKEIPHDWELNIIAAINNGLYFYNKSFVKYRIHQNNTIGLDKEMGVKQENNKKSLLSYDARIINAKIIENTARSFASYIKYFDNKKIFDNTKTIKQYIDYRIARTAALQQRSILKVLSIYRYYYFYTKTLDFKGRIGDMICVINKKIK